MGLKQPMMPQPPAVDPSVAAKEAESEAKLAALRGRGTTELTPAKAAEVEIKAATTKFQIALREAKLKQKMIEAESALLAKRLFVLAKETGDTSMLNAEGDDLEAGLKANLTEAELDKFKEIKSLSFNEILELLVIGVLLGAHFGFWISSVKATSVAASVLLGTCHIVYVSIIGWIIFGEKLNRKGIYGTLFSLLGIIILFSEQQSAESLTFILALFVQLSCVTIK